eukprot:TRINITY_DN13415_c0_g1_i1.p1 TRINITY_DN13415_c0_g1~~TRINITY_DN13415_c0_g1_i1.p1  ORF type:complete len:226 (-),score=40.73 TRINITY_DN13415_c0_g1_i1:38-628(-)
MQKFTTCYETALQSPAKGPHNFVLSTVDEQGRPHGRTVSLHTYNDDGFVFCSAYNGPKGTHLLNNPFAAMTFCWDLSNMQLRVTGSVKRLDRESSERLFRLCRTVEQTYYYIMGNNSEEKFYQSSVIDSHEERAADFKEKLDGFKEEGAVVPLPEEWGGFIIMPDSIELLDMNIGYNMRTKFSLVDGEWIEEMLSP